MEVIHASVRQHMNSHVMKDNIHVTAWPNINSHRMEIMRQFHAYLAVDFICQLSCCHIPGYSSGCNTKVSTRLAGTNPVYCQSSMFTVSASILRMICIYPMACTTPEQHMSYAYVRCMMHLYKHSKQQQ
jgi:hypothetical protein